MTKLQLHKISMENGLSLSITTALSCRLELGWTFRGMVCLNIGL